MRKKKKVEILKNNLRYHVIVHIIKTLTITLLSFISFPYACRALGDAGMGTYSWANTFVYYFLTLAKLGIPTLAIRECAKVKDDKKQLSHKVQEFFVLQCICTILSFIFMVFLMVSLKGQLWEHKELIFLLSTNFLVGAFSFEWVYLTLEKHFFIAFRSIFSLVISALMIVLFIKIPQDEAALPFENQIYLYAFFTCLVTYITVFFNLLFLRKHISLKKEAPYHLKPYLKPLFVLFGLSLVLTLYNQNDSFILGLLDPSKKEVGSYSVGVKAIEIVITIITSLSAVFIPKATSYYKNNDIESHQKLIDYSMNICFFIALPAIATLTALSPTVSSFIAGGRGYEEATSVLIILASMTLTYSISDLIYHTILLPSNKEKIYLYVMGGGVLLNLSLSLLFAYSLKTPISISIALGTAISDFIVLIIMIILTKKQSFPAIINKNNCKILITSVIVCIISHYLNLYFPFAVSNLIKLAFILIIDALFYIGILLLIKENIVSSLFKKKE